MSPKVEAINRTMESLEKAAAHVREMDDLVDRSRELVAKIEAIERDAWSLVEVERKKIKP